MHDLAAPVVSAVTAGALLVIQMLLALTVALARRRNKQSLGDGGSDVVLRLARRHGNFAENAAIFVAALTLFELLGADRLTVEIFAGVFVAGRLAHALGMTFRNTVNVFRVLGIFATVGVGITLGVRLMMLAIPLLTAAF